MQHDPETPECSPGGTDGNYIMYARATSGDRPNNNKFSKCSTQSMAQVISAKAQGEHGCFIRKHSPPPPVTRGTGPGCVLCTMCISKTYYTQGKTSSVSMHVSL